MPGLKKKQNKTKNNDKKVRSKNELFQKLYFVVTSNYYRKKTSINIDIFI